MNQSEHFAHELGISPQVTILRQIDLADHAIVQGLKPARRVRAGHQTTDRIAGHFQPGDLSTPIFEAGADRGGTLNNGPKPHAAIAAGIQPLSA